MLDPAAPSRSSWHYAWYILAVGTLVVFGALGLARFGYTMVLPAMQVALGLSNAQAGGLATANLAGYLVLAVAGGALASRYGPRRVIAAGLAVTALGLALTGLAGGFGAAALWRGVAGLGSGASNVAVMGLLAAWFAPQRRGLAAGIGVTGSSFALIAVGPGVPYLVRAVGENGWRACWFVFGGVTLLLAALAWLVLRNSPAAKGLLPLGTPGTPAPEPVDPAAPADPPPGQTAPGAVAVDVAGSAPTPGALDWAAVYRAPRVWLLGLVYVAFGFSYIIYLTFFTKYLITECGYTPVTAGGLYMLIGWCSLLCGLIWGWVSDVIGRRAALCIVYLIHAAAFALFAKAPDPAGLTISAILFGLSAWSIPAIVAAACGDMLGPRLAPAALGFVTLFFGIGQAAGPGVAGAMADASGSLAPALLLAAAVAACGAVGSLLVRTGPLGPAAGQGVTGAVPDWVGTAPGPAVPPT